MRLDILVLTSAALLAVASDGREEAPSPPAPEPEVSPEMAARSMSFAEAFTRVRRIAAAIGIEERSARLKTTFDEAGGHGGVLDLSLRSETAESLAELLARASAEAPRVEVDRLSMRTLVRDGRKEISASLRAIISRGAAASEAPLPALIRGLEESARKADIEIDTVNAVRRPGGVWSLSIHVEGEPAGDTAPAWRVVTDAVDRALETVAVRSMDIDRDRDGTERLKLDLLAR